jgi:hypothetical protein
MKLGLRRTILGAAATMFVCVLGVAVNGQGRAGGAAPAPAAGQERAPLAKEVFHNVTVLGDLTVNEFMGTMGIFSSSLGMSCEDCHAADDRKWENFQVDNPRKRMARRMITMVQEINKTNFGGRPLVSCYSCHRGADRPRVDPDLTQLYGGVPQPDPRYIVAVNAPGQPAPAVILDKYIAAVGGAAKAAQLTSFTAQGTAVGYGPESAEERKVEIYAKAPNQFATTIHTGNGDMNRVYNGVNGWLAETLRPVDVLALSGRDLEGMRADAMTLFPSNIKTMLNNLKTGSPSVIDDRDVSMVQGTTPSGTVVSLYFDDQTGMLRRMMRYVESPVGPLVTQWDYEDYKDVNGFKMPFKVTHTWLDGREIMELTAYQVNANIPATRFNKPPASVAPKPKA